jgi:four helix bundle protein
MSEELKRRMQVFALQVIRLVSVLPNDKVGDVIGRQLLKCGTSVGANYRAASRAKSQADFIAKMGIVEEESDESLYWLELLIEAGLIQRRKAADLLAEADQFVAIAVASIRTARKNRNQGRR